MKNITLLFLVFLSQTTLASRVLVIGDSHMAGPFGSKIHGLLSNEFDQVTTLGHSSSSALHWIGTKEYRLSGGVFNQLYFEKKQYLNPNPTHWREKVIVPKLENVLLDNAYHAQWKNLVGQDLNADIVVVELGANDSRTIADERGNINRAGYESRKEAIESLIDQIEASGARCLWIGPPNGSKKSPANQKALYAFLKEAIDGRCPMMNSNHFKATGCDGVHFSCPGQEYKAINWANEAFQFVKSNI